MFTFGKPTKKKTLRAVINLHAEAEQELFEPKKKTAAWEERQVDASESRGLGFNWVEVSRGERRKGKLSPEKRRGVHQLQAFEHDIRLGPSRYMARIREFGKVKALRKTLGREVITFWEWLTH